MGAFEWHLDRPILQRWGCLKSRNSENPLLMSFFFLFSPGDFRKIRTYNQKSFFTKMIHILCRCELYVFEIFLKHRELVYTDFGTFGLGSKNGFFGKSLQIASDQDKSGSEWCKYAGKTIRNIFSTIWGYLGVPTTTQGCQNDYFGNLFKLRPTKVKVTQNDVNMQEKRLEIFFRPSGGT